MRIAIALVMIFFALPAGAQDTAQTQALLQFAANNARFDKTVSDRARTVFNRQFPGCGKIDRLVRQLPQALSPLTFPPAANTDKFPAPMQGLWIEHIKIRACSRVQQVNLLAAGKADGEVVMLPLLPGDTRADPAIQRESERIASAAVVKSDSDCSDAPVIANTRFLSFKGTNETLSQTDTGQGWFEEWEYRFCQKMVTTQLAFTPNTEGAVQVKARPAVITTDSGAKAARVAPRSSP